MTHGMKTLSSLLVIAGIATAGTSYFGEVLNESNTAVPNAKIIVQSTGDTLFTNEEGKFGEWNETPLKLTNTVKHSLAQPTLFNNNLYFEAARAGVTYSAAVMNLRGQILWEQRGTAAAPGVVSFSCNQQFAKGIYLLHTVVDGVEMVTKTNNMNRPGITAHSPGTAPASFTRADIAVESDTLFISAQGHVRCAVPVAAGATTPVAITMNTCENSLTVTPASDTVTVALNSEIALTATAEDSTGDIQSLLWLNRGIIFDTLPVDSAFKVSYAVPGENWVYVIALNEYGEQSKPDSVNIVAYTPAITLDAPDSLTVTEDEMLPILLSQCLIADNNGTGPYALSIAAPTDADSFTVLGSDTLVPFPDFYGECKIAVTVTDNAVQSNSDTIIVTVTPVNDKPTFTVKEDTIVVSEASAIAVDTLFSALNSGAYNEAQAVTVEATVLSGSALFEMGKEPTISEDIVLSFTTKQNVSGTATVTLFANDGESLSDTSLLTVIVVDTNYAPTFDLEDSYTVAIGDTITIPVEITDPDQNDTHVITTSNPAFTVSGTNIVFTPGNDYVTYRPGEFFTVVVTVSDGEEVAQDTIKMNIASRQWELMGTFPSEDTISGITATDYSNFHVVLRSGYLVNYTEKEQTSKSSVVGFDTLSNSIFTSNQAVKQYKDSIYVQYVNMGSYWAQFSISDASQGVTEYVQGYRGHSQMAQVRDDNKTFRAYVVNSMGKTYRYMNDPYTGTSTPHPDFLSATDMEAARSGVNVFLCDAESGIYNKVGTTGAFEKVSTMKCIDVEIASLTGDILYFISESNDLFLVKNGTASTSITFETLIRGNISDIVAFDENRAWVITTDKKVYFTQDRFSTKMTENIDGKVIRDIIVSEDRSTVFALTEDNCIYRY